MVSTALVWKYCNFYHRQFRHISIFPCIIIAFVKLLCHPILQHMLFHYFLTILMIRFEDKSTIHFINDIPQVLVVLHIECGTCTQCNCHEVYHSTVPMPGAHLISPIGAVIILSSSSILWPKTQWLICNPTPANEALCGKINFELWAKM